jgi:hypothetical protein
LLRMENPHNNLLPAKPSREGFWRSGWRW